jgi:hypothetical protein
VKIGRKKEKEMKRFESMKTRRIKVEKREREEDGKNIIEFLMREKKKLLFRTVPDSRINSWETWFIFNLRKINNNQYRESTPGYK